MAIFNFGRKQKLNAELRGRTSGREMFQVDEYNNIKKNNLILGLIISAILTCFYFWWTFIPNKIKGFMSIIFIGCGIWLYFNIKNQSKLRRNLY